MDQSQTSWSSLHHDDASLLGMTRHHCLTLKDGLGNLSLYHSLLLILYCSTHTDRSTYPRTFIHHRQALLTRTTYLSDSSTCTRLPVYKHPVFQQSSPKLDLILNINVLESSPSASPFPHLLHKPLRVISSNTRDFYLFKYSPPVHLLVQVVLSRPVEALTQRPGRISSWYIGRMILCDAQHRVLVLRLDEVFPNLGDLYLLADRAAEAMLYCFKWVGE